MKITLCVDKQDRGNPSEELKQYLIDIGCPLRSYKDVFDELKISTDDTNNLVGIITRRCYVDKYGVLKKLDVEETQTLEIPEIQLLEGTNYVYILEYTNLNMKVEYLTNAEMNKYFATKMEMNSTIQQTYDSIMLKVSEKADSTAVASMIKILANEIALRVVKGDVVNQLNVSDELISIIGNRLEIDTDNFKLSKEGDIEAKSGKIAGYSIVKNTLKGSNVGMCGLLGEEYAFWAGSESGANAPFRIGHNGELKSSNATITGGNIKLNSPYNDPKFIIGTNSNNDYNTYVSEGQISLGNSTNTNGMILIDNIRSYENNDVVPTIYLSEKNSNVNHTDISSRSIDTPILYQHSLAKMKKNFEKLEDGISIIKNTKIYKYNLIDENDNSKKHIGVVIGKGYLCSNEIINNTKTGIDIYSMVSVAFKAIQEQQEIIEKLQKEVNRLKESEKV